MRTINHVLSTIPYTGAHWDGIASAFHGVTITRADGGDREAIKNALKTADVALLNGDIPPFVLEHGKNLKWVHCNHAGVNMSAKPELFERGIILTCGAGRSGPVLAEHVFYLLLSLIYDSRNVERQQTERIWNNLYETRRGLYGKTMGIIGLGYTGIEVAKRAKAFDMRVLGFDRNDVSSVYVDETFSLDKNDGGDIDRLLKESDVIVLSCRLSDETYHLIDASALKKMKETALLINIARGAVIDEAALVSALKDGRLAGFGSDVFEVEPLPADSPLWGFDNVVITPHCTPEMPDMPGNCVEIIRENVRRYVGGETLKNEQTVRDVYTK